MENQFNEQKWGYLLDTIYRLNCTKTVDEFRSGCFVWIRPIVHFTKGLFYLASREDGKILHFDPLTFRYDDALKPLEGFGAGKYPNAWDELQFSLRSSVKRNSDLRDKNFYEAAVYRDLYEPFDIHHAIKTVLIHDDTLLGIFVLFRPRTHENFSEWDVKILDLLKDHLALKLYQLLTTKNVSDMTIPFLAKYGLTIRENEIVDLMMQNYSSAEICKKLFISSSTYRKHLHNIYKKMGVSTQLQLFQLASELYQR